MGVSKRYSQGWLALCYAFGPLASHALAIITWGGTGNNYTTPPGGVGNYEIDFGWELATAISPTVMVTATHIGSGSSSTVTIGSSTYNVELAATLDDLALWQFVPNQPGAVFSSYAPLYTGDSEVGMSLVDVGRGVARGSAITGGWNWGSYTGQVSWGTNTVSAVDTDNQLGLSGAFGGDYLQYDFDNNPSDPNECIIGNDDSGGGVFVDNNGVYQLAGVNSLVDTVLNSSGQTVNAALYDEQGYYEESGSGSLMQITSPYPESSYATRIASRMNLIGVVDGAISPANAANYPIFNDGNFSVYSSMTTGAIIGGAAVTLGGPNTPNTKPTLQIAPNSGASNLSSLTLDTGSTLDVTNNKIIITGVSATEQSAILQWLASGYNDGAWNGTGIISSTAAASGGRCGVGYASGNITSGLSSGEVEIAYTLYGDTNLEGVVNAVDFGVLAANLDKSVTGGWQMGDFTYSGVVNSIDFGLFAQNYGSSIKGVSAGVTSADWAALDAFAVANGLSSEVPEPAASGMLAAGTLTLFARRRRRRC